MTGGTGDTKKPANARKRGKVPAPLSPVGKKTQIPTVDKRASFVREYLIDCNATQAAIRAGYSAKTAKQIGSRLLTNVDVMTEINKAKVQRAERVEVTADLVLAELLKIARVDLSQLYDEHGNLKDIHSIPEDARRAIAGIEVDEIWEGRGENREQTGVTRKVKLWDKPRALELLGKHLKLFTEVHEHRGLERLAEEYRQAEARVAGRQ